MPGLRFIQFPPDQRFVFVNFNQLERARVESECRRKTDHERLQLLRQTGLRPV